MVSNYSRDNLIKEIIARHGGGPWVALDQCPASKYIACARCSHHTVRIQGERYGDGNRDHVYWAADTFVGRCQRKECRHINLWIELVKAEELEKENRRLLILACDRVLKSL